MGYPKVTDGIVITEKVVTAATRIWEIKAITTTKLRTTNLEIDGNTRREIPRSLSYMNPQHFIPAKFGESFFKQFNLAMKLTKEIKKSR